MKRFQEKPENVYFGPFSDCLDQILDRTRIYQILPSMLIYLAKTNDSILHKSQKTIFLPFFGPFLPFFGKMRIFPKMTSGAVYTL